MAEQISQLKEQMAKNEEDRQAERAEEKSNRDALSLEVSKLTDELIEKEGATQAIEKKLAEKAKEVERLQEAMEKSVEERVRERGEADVKAQALISDLKAQVQSMTTEMTKKEKATINEEKQLYNLKAELETEKNRSAMAVQAMADAVKESQDELEVNRKQNYYSSLNIF